MQSRVYTNSLQVFTNEDVLGVEHQTMVEERSVRGIEVNDIVIEERCKLVATAPVPFPWAQAV